MQFSKNPILKNFGDLPIGEIPEPLKYNRPFQSTTLANGVQVCTEKTGSGMATVGVYVGAGSRQDTLATTGAAHLTRLMLTKGSSARSKSDLAAEVEQMGGVWGGKTERELSSLSLTVMKADACKAAELLGDAVANASLDSAEVELTKQELAGRHEGNYKDYEGTLLENAHFNSYRDHQLGQPTKGDPDMLQGLSVDDLQNYKAANYYGDNLVVVGTGNVDHDSLVDAVNKSMGALAKTTNVPTANSEKAIYTPSLLFIRDDEMVNTNVGVFYDAPTWKDPDFYGFILLKHMFGQFRIN